MGSASTPLVDNELLMAYPAKGLGRAKWSCSYAESTGTTCDAFPGRQSSSGSIGYPVVDPRDFSDAPPGFELCVVHSVT